MELFGRGCNLRRHLNVGLDSTSPFGNANPRLEYTVPTKVTHLESSQYSYIYNVYYTRMYIGQIKISNQCYLLTHQR